MTVEDLIKELKKFKNQKAEVVYHYKEFNHKITETYTYKDCKVVVLGEK